MVRSWTKSGFSWRLFLYSVKVSARKARGGDHRAEAEAEGGFRRPGGIGTGDGSCQGLIALRDGLDLHQGTEGGGKV